MKVKLLEHYQDSTHILHPDQEVEVDDALGAWLVEHRKAVALEVKAEPMTHEEFVAPEIHENVTNVQIEVIDPEPEDKPKRRGRK